MKGLKFSVPILQLGLVISFLILLFSACSFFIEVNTLYSLHKEVKRIEQKVRSGVGVQKQDLILKKGDPHYLDSVQSLRLLIPEMKKLEMFLAEHPEEESLFKHLLFLKSHNQIVFSETRAEKVSQFQEKEYNQQAPVEMNEEDLKKLLSLIEGTMIGPYGPKEGRPFFLITEFSLSKKELFRDEKVFAVSLKILKREGV